GGVVIHALAGGAAQAEQVTIGGSLPLNDILDIIDVHVSGSSTVAASGTISLTALDDPEIKALAGGAAVSVGGNGVGAAIAKNMIGDQVRAYVDASSVTSTAGSVTLTATSLPNIDSLAAGAAAASDFSGAGSVSFNIVSSTVEAYGANGAALQAS